MGDAVILHLIGFPATGKYTLARAVAAEASARGQRYVVLDNHHTSNVLFPVLDLDGATPVPSDVWDRVGEIRAALLRTIEDLSPRSWSFVFTNVLTDDKASERGHVDRLVQLARATGRRYVPVLVVCDEATLLARVANRDRSERMKWVDADAVGDFVRSHALVVIDDLHPLTVDTGRSDPAAAAALVLDHIDRLAAGGPTRAS